MPSFIPGGEHSTGPVVGFTALADANEELHSGQDAAVDLAIGIMGISWEDGGKIKWEDAGIPIIWEDYMGRLYGKIMDKNRGLALMYWRMSFF